MALPPPRRPRFLAAVPDAPGPTAASFVRRDKPAPRLPALARSGEAGEAALLAAAAEGRREALDRVSQALEMLRSQAARLAEQARADALEIGFQVARRILEEEVRAAPEPLFALVRTALKRAGESRRITLHLCPDDAARLESDQGRAAVEGVTAARVDVLPDPALQPGDCSVETDFGAIDGRLETRLSELRRAVESQAEGAA